MFKKKNIFFTTLEEMTAVMVETAEKFKEGVAELNDIPAFAREMKELEHKCDAFTHTILQELNKTFITPIERDDIMALTKSLDDVVDGIEASVSRFEMYHVQGTDEYIIQFADILMRCMLEIQQGIHLLTQKKLLAIRKHCIALNELENEADALLRKGITSIFANTKDPIELVKRKDIYERLETTTDCCEDVANTLESIIMRNS